MYAGALEIPDSDPGLYRTQVKEPRSKHKKQLLQKLPTREHGVPATRLWLPAFLTLKQAGTFLSRIPISHRYESQPLNASVARRPISHLEAPEYKLKIRNPQSRGLFPLKLLFNRRQAFFQLDEFFG